MSDNIVHLVDSFDNLAEARPISVVDLPTGNYGALAHNGNQETARYLPAPHSVNNKHSPTGNRAGALREGEKLYVAPVTEVRPYKEGGRE